MSALIGIVLGILYGWVAWPLPVWRFLAGYVVVALALAGGAILAT